MCPILGNLCYLYILLSDRGGLSILRHLRGNPYSLSNKCNNQDDQTSVQIDITSISLFKEHLI